MMRSVTVTIALVMFAVSARAEELAVEIIDTSFALEDGSRVLQQSIDVPASINEVWAAFTTGEGLENWAVPFAHVELALDGLWESSYDPNARPGDSGNIRSRIISYLPMRMLSLKAEQAPPDFPNPELLDGMFSVFTFEALDGGLVRVTVSGLGYRRDPATDRLYEQFAAANAWTLRRLHQRFTDGPVDWTQPPRTTITKDD